MTPSGPTLSVCMIVKNEAHQLATALANFKPFADEIVVVDTGSTDATKAVAHRFTAQVSDFPWCDDFSAARNVSLERAHGDYVLWMDADDRVDRENREKLRQIKQHFDGKRAFYFLLQGMNADAPSEKLYQLRCVPRREGVRFRYRIHEELITSALAEGLTLLKTDITIEHHGYHDRTLLEEKVRRNLHLLEKERAGGRDDPHIHIYLALSYDHIGQADQAIATMLRALDQLERGAGAPTKGTSPALDFVPFLMEAHLFLAAAYARQSEPAAALRHLTRAQALNDENAQTWYRMGCLFQELSRHHEALRCFGGALGGRTMPGFFPLPPLPPAGLIMVRIAYTHLQLGRKETALKLMAKAAENGISLGDGWEELGLIALKAQNFGLARAAYECAQRLGELSIDSRCNLALLHDKHGEPLKAIEGFAAVLAEVPGHPAALANLAHLHFRLNNRDLAKAAFTRLLNQGRKDLDVILALAVMAGREGNRERLRELAAMLPEATNVSGDRSAEEAINPFEDLASRLAPQGKRQLWQWASETASCFRQLYSWRLKSIVSESLLD